MSEKDKQDLIKFALIYFFIFGILPITGGILKTANLFYHQVILKNQVAGEPIKR